MLEMKAVTCYNLYNIWSDQPQRVEKVKLH